MPAAIETRGLTKKFGDFTAVDKISFDVKKGEIFGFLGPNGAGKSTTIRMLCTLSRPTDGSATVAGYDIKKQDGQVREHIGLVSEKMIMYDDLTAVENLKLFGRLYDIPGKKLDTRVNELLKIVQMEKWAKTRIKQYSTGMKQRINVIRAMVNEPKILFLDEPTLGLDPQSTAEIRELIRKINTESSTTIILTTHMMMEADMLCDRIGIIDKGRIVALETPAGLKKLVSGTDKTLFEMDIPNLSPIMIDSIKKLKCVSSVTHVDETRLKIHAKGAEPMGRVLSTVIEQGGKIRSVMNLEPTLEDVFLHLTGREVRDSVDKEGKSRGHRRGPRGHRSSNGRGR